MPKYDFDIGILGGGSAGLTVAAGAAQFGVDSSLEGHALIVDLQRT